MIPGLGMMGLFGGGRCWWSAGRWDPYLLWPLLTIALFLPLVHHLPWGDQLLSSVFSAPWCCAYNRLWINRARDGAEAFNPESHGQDPLSLDLKLSWVLGHNSKKLVHMSTGWILGSYLPLFKETAVRLGNMDCKYQQHARFRSANPYLWSVPFQCFPWHGCSQGSDPICPLTTFMIQRKWLSKSHFPGNEDNSSLFISLQCLAHSEWSNKAGFSYYLLIKSETHSDK